VGYYVFEGDQPFVDSSGLDNHMKWNGPLIHQTTWKTFVKLGLDTDFYILVETDDVY